MPLKDCTSIDSNVLQWSRMDSRLGLFYHQRCFTCLYWPDPKFGCVKGRRNIWRFESRWRKCSSITWNNYENNQFRLKYLTLNFLFYSAINYLIIIFFRFMMARAKNIRLRMSEITQEGIDRALKRVDGLDHKIQKIEDPGDKEVFMVRYYVKQEQ